MKGNQTASYCLVSIIHWGINSVGWKITHNFQPIMCSIKNNILTYQRRHNLNLILLFILFTVTLLASECNDLCIY